MNTKRDHDCQTKLSKILMLALLVISVFATMIPFQIIYNEIPVYAASRPAVFGYITWQYFSSNSWNTDKVLGALTHIIAPALVATSASNPSVKGMYGDNLDKAYPLLVNAAHPRGIKVLPYFYTGSMTGTSLNSVISAGTLPTLVASLKSVILQYNLDGIDLDLEETMNPSNNSLFIDALYAALNPYGKLITIDAQYGEVPGVSPDVSVATAQKVDYIHVLAYDMWGYPDQNAGFPHSSYVDSVAAIQKWINSGFPKSKLNMGISFFGKSSNPYSLLEYNKIVDAINPSSGQDYGTVNGIYYSWNGINTVKAKADWVVQNAIGGIMVFATGYDKLNDSRSLLQAIADEMNNPISIVQPSVTTSAANSIDTSTATLNGNLVALGSASSVNVSFDYGLTSTYSYSTSGQSKTTTGTFGTNLINLTPGTVYHFRAKADAGGSGTTYGVDQQFTTSSSSSAGSNTLYTTYHATEQGTSLGNYAVQTFTPQTTHTVKQVKLNLHNSGSSGTVVISIRATSPTTGEPTGTDLVKSAAISQSTIPAAYTTTTFDLDSGYLLQAGTKYAIYMYSTATGLYTMMDSAGTYSSGSYMNGSNGTSWNHRDLWDIYFEEWGTAYVNTPPSVTTSAANSIDTSTATLNGNLVALGSASSVNVSFDYGLTSTYSYSTSGQSKTTTGTFGTNLINLTPGTVYHFRAKADAGGSGTTYGVDQQFTTSSSSSAGSNTLYTTYHATEQGTSLGNYAVQTFTPQTTHTVKQVKLNLHNSGSSGTVVISIRATSPTTGEPTGTDLVKSAAISQSTIPAAYTTTTFDLGSGYLLQAGTKYAIYMYSTATGLYTMMDSAGTYSSGSYMNGSNGTSWNHRDLWDIYFEEWGTAYSSAGSNTLYTTYHATEQGTSLGNYAVQTFTPQTTHTVKQVKLNLYNSGSSGTVVISIRATSPTTGEPTSADLVKSAAISQSTLPAAYTTTTFDLGSGYLLQAGTKYAIYMYSTATGLYTMMDSAGTYSSGSYMNGSNGTSWNHRDLWDIYFEEWGTP